MKRFLALGAVLGTLLFNAVPAQALLSDRLSLSVVTYNIRSGAYRIEHVAETLKALKPDIVCLQEVHGPPFVNGWIDQADFLGKSLGLNAVFSKSRLWVSGEYGIAILSRFPITAQETLPLPGRFGEEPEIYLRVTVQTPLGPLNVVTTHLHSRSHFKGTKTADFRYEQAQFVVDQMLLLPEPVIFAGDLNTFGFNPKGNIGVRMLFRKHFLDVFNAKGRGRDATFPSGFPITRLDYIFLKGRFQAWESRVIKSKASDHRPLWGRIELIASPAPSESKL